MATKSDPGRDPRAITEGYSMSGSQANSVALNPAGTTSGGKRFSVVGPVSAGTSSARSKRATSARGRVMGVSSTANHVTETLPEQPLALVIDRIRGQGEH